MKLRLTALSLILAGSQAASAANYCLAIRGNGQLEPAHWGAVSSVVEKLGLPQAQAGGSSASITMFLLDAIATNPLIKNAKPDEQRLGAALLVKSFEGFAGYIMNTPQFQDFKTLIGNLSAAKANANIKGAQSLLSGAVKLKPADAVAYLKTNQALIAKDFKLAVSVGLISQATIKQIQDAVNAALKPNLDPMVGYGNIKYASFLLGELYYSVTKFGSFDAVTDANLFFRAGIVDFDKAAHQIGILGDFYSRPLDTGKWQAFLSRCSVIAQGKLWPELMAADASCAVDFNTLVSEYMAAPHQDFSSNQVGVTIPSFPSTSVLIEQAATDAITAFGDYAKAMSPTFGSTGLQIKDIKQVKMGYWGDDAALARIYANLPQDDEKSRRFFALGRESWSKIMSISPAEPGLAPLKQFDHAGKILVSAGGWSDLHPTLVLKAAGCKNVVYVTRRGNDSKFATGVATRLLGQATATRLFDLSNPDSSYRRSLSAADAVKCTNWDLFDAAKGPHPMVDEAYKAMFHVRADGGLVGLGLLPELPETAEFNGCF